VALKFLPEDPGEKTPQALERFRREARAASALSHPNICTIHEIADEGGISSSLWSISMARTLKHVITKPADGIG